MESVDVDFEYERDAIDDANRVSVGASQSLYISGAAGESTAVLPSVLWHSTVSSISSLVDEIGDIDIFLSRELGWTEEHVAQVLSPEQRDGAAKIIYAIKVGKDADRAFLLADEAGFGKGRILMTVACWSKRQGHIPVVFTKYPSLFSNLWQDIQDLGQEETLGRPFIINESVSIVDLKNSDGKNIFGNISPKIHKATIQNSDTLPDGYGFIISTWSQLSVKESPKVNYLKRVFEHNRCCYIGDESHTAVTQSALISNNANILKDMAYSICDTSATSSRDIANMSSYRAVYPWLSDMKAEMFSMSDAYKIWVSEFSVEEAVKNGQMIRREMDTSGIELEVLYPQEEAIRKNTAIRDTFAHSVSLMADLSDAIKALCDEKNRDLPESELKTFETTNFFSRLSLLSLQLEACMVSEFSARLACDEHLEKNVKPLIILDMTMESSANAILNMDDAIDDAVEEQARDDEEDDCDMARKPMTIHDLMYLALERVMTYRFGKDRFSVAENENHEIADLYLKVKNAIAEFPEMPASPIDHVRDIIEAEGRKRFESGEIAKPWKVGELSGRTAQIVNGQYVKRTEDRNAVISKYNSDDYDAVIATSAGSTGGSMHHAANFKANKRRSGIEAIGCRNAIDRKQMWGRISRRGNLSLPRYQTLCTGTAYSMCRLALENAKAMRLNASVSGDKNHGLLTKGEDILSPAANNIARDFLLRNPSIASHLRIDMESQAAETEDSWFVKKLFGRSMMLPSEVVQRILNQFMKELERSNSYAANLTIDHLGDGWNISNSMTLVEPGEIKEDDTLSYFKGHIGLVEITREVEYQGLTTEDLPGLSSEKPAASYPALLHEGKQRHLTTFIPKWARSLKQALDAGKDTSAYPSIRRNPCVLENERIDKAQQILPLLGVGEGFVLPDKFGEQRPGIITNIRVPQNPFLWKEYIISYVVPGDNQTYMTDLFLMMDIPWVRHIDNDITRNRFQAPDNGKKQEKMTLLAGNMIRACSMASRIGVGRKVRYVDAENRERSGILVNQMEREKLLMSRLIVPTPVAAYRLIRDNKATLVYKSGSGKDLLSLNMDPQGNVFINMKGSARDQKILDKLRVILSGITGVKKSSNTFKVTQQDMGAALTAVTNQFNLTCTPSNRVPLLKILSDPMMSKDIDYEPTTQNRRVEDEWPTLGL